MDLQLSTTLSLAASISQPLALIPATHLNQAPGLHPQTGPIFGQLVLRYCRLQSQHRVSSPMF